MYSGISSRPVVRLTKHEKDDVLGMLGRIEKAASRPYSYGQAMPRVVVNSDSNSNVISPAQRVVAIANNINKPRSRKVANGFPEEFFNYFEIEQGDDTPPPAQSSFKMVS